jgi:hypothetical protein
LKPIWYSLLAALIALGAFFFVYLWNLGGDYSFLAIGTLFAYLVFVELVSGVEVARKSEIMKHEGARKPRRNKIATYCIILGFFLSVVGWVTQPASVPCTSHSCLTSILWDIYKPYEICLLGGLILIGTGATLRLPSIFGRSMPQDTLNEKISP